MKRRVFQPHTLRLLTLVLLLSALPGFGCKAAPQRYETTFFDLFDTVTVVRGYAQSEAAFSAEADRLYAALSEYHRLFDIYRTYPDCNNLKTINDNAGGDPVPVDRKIIDLLLFCRMLCESSGGRVDITLGPVLHLWHEAREAAQSDPAHASAPDRSALLSASLHTGFDKLEIDEAASTVRLNDPLASLDVGAVAKGFAAECVGKGMPDGFLMSLGGNVRAMGGKPNGEPFSIGIQSPDDGDALLCTVSVVSGSVVTSGDYQRCFVADGVKYHHIIDPDTLFPAEKWRAVSILCADSALADGLSTALFLLDHDAGLALLDTFSADALWVAPDGTVLTTDGFAAAMRPAS